MSEKIKCVLGYKVAGHMAGGHSEPSMTKEFKFEASTDEDAKNVLKIAKMIAEEDHQVTVEKVAEVEREIGR